jgi:hypothetical protein
MVERKKSIRVRGLHSEERDDDFDGTTSSERIPMVWPLTMGVWAFESESDAQLRLQNLLFAF